MNWLDRNMETLLQQAPAATVRFVSNNRDIATTDDESVNSSTAAGSEPQQKYVKQFIDATARPITSDFVKPVTTTATIEPNASYSSRPIGNDQASSSSSTQYEPEGPKTKVKTRGKAKPVAEETVTPKKEEKEEPVTQQYSSVDIIKAEKRRRKEFRQVQTRFADTFKSMR